MLTGKAKLAGVMGWPIGHSKSPALHNYWINELKLDGAYVPLAVKPENLATALRALPALGFSGCNLTVPHKEEALRAVDEIDPIAQRIGAINTVIVTADGKLRGTNTDAFGFMANLKAGALQFRAEAAPAVVLGAGGAARAVCAALVDAGCREVRLINRNRERAEILASRFGKAIAVHDWAARSQDLSGAGLLVNTTTLGMTGQPALEIDLDALPKSAIVHDIVYAPLETPLLAAARARGHHVVDGLGMLLYQAQPAFEAWFGLKPEVTPGLRAHILGKSVKTPHRSWPVSFARRRWRRQKRTWPFLVIGLTGSIAMGKSTAAAMMRRFGWPVFDSDASSRALTAHGGAAIPEIAAAFAGVVGPMGLDRAALAEAVFSKPDALRRLEGILHPKIKTSRQKFLMTAAIRRAAVVVLDVPLLFETGGDRDVDIVVVASAPAFLQRQRAMGRKGMTAEKLKGILARQVADHTKRRQAFVVVPSGLGKREALRRLTQLRHLRPRG